MIKIEPAKLIIEIETSSPVELAYELQTSIIKILQLRDENQDTDRLETHYILNLLQELLPAVENYKHIN